MCFLGWQSTLIQTEQKVMMPNSLPEKSMTLQIMPSPNRYALWVKTALPEQEDAFTTKSPPSVDTSFTPEFPNVLLNNPMPPASTIPTSLPMEVPPLPEALTFNLIGIAQGTDGIVATVKIKEGNTEEIKDVRQGITLLPGYTVIQIAEEYVLLKTSKGGKTIRVD